MPMAPRSASRWSDPAQADAWHEAGAANGGAPIEDPPGVRQGSFGKFYLAYLRDPDGNKLCALHRLPARSEAPSGVDGQAAPQGTQVTGWRASSERMAWISLGSFVRNGLAIPTMRGRVPVS